jgi:hypothetical protein
MTSEQRAANSRALLPEKIASRRRKRLAIVYLRQSTPHSEATESSRHARQERDNQGRLADPTSLSP